MIEAEGVQPLTDRRNFLQRAATFLAAGAAGTTVIGGAHPAATAALVQEDPAIIALGERIEPLLVAARGNLYCDRRTTFGKKVVRLIELAEKYEAERAAAIEQSGLREAMARHWEAAYEIEKLAYETVEIEPQTMAGALIQARALTAYAEAEIEVGHYRGRSGQLVGLALAQSIARLSVV
jgi:hypothetical protein